MFNSKTIQKLIWSKFEIRLVLVNGKVDFLILILKVGRMLSIQIFDAWN